MSADVVAPVVEPRTGMGRFVAKHLPRGSVERFVQNHAWQWEGTMALLTVGYVVLAFAGDESALIIPDEILVGLAVVFLVEFSLRLWNAPDRLDYLRHHWVDGVTAIPLLGPLRALRLLRLLRLGAVLRVISMVTSRVDSNGRTSLWYLGPVLVVIWMSSSYAFWTVEKGVNSAISSFPDAMYLAFVSIFTLGYGDAHAVSPAGRLIGGGLIFFGIGFVGFLSGQITARVLRQRDPARIVQEEMNHLRREISEMKSILRGADGEHLVGPVVERNDPIPAVSQRRPVLDGIDLAS